MCHHTTVLITSKTLYMKPHPIWGQNIHLTCDITAIIWVITSTVWTTSHPLFLWHHTRHMSGIVCITQEITSSHFDLKPPFWGHHPHYIRHCVHCICVITPTLSMISQPLYVWYHIKYIWDILSTVFMTSYPPCMTTQHCELITPHSAYLWQHFATEDVTSTLSHQATVFMTSHPLQEWHHNPCSRHRTNCIFVITTSPLISHPLLYDTTPTISVTS